MKVVLAGTPNAGKTTLFNALTHSNLRTGNFHGVTTSPSFKTESGVTYVDVPGMYAFTPYSMEEKSAADEITSADLIVNVLDALTLENNLSLTKSLRGANKNFAVFITKKRELERRGGKIDLNLLSEYLGAPVFDNPRALKKAIKSGDFRAEFSKKEIALNKVYTGASCAVTGIDKLFLNPVFAICFFIFAVTAMFFLAFHPLMPGTLLKNLINKLICVDFCGFVTSKMQSQAAISLISEGVLGGAGAVLSFLPQLAILYLVLTLLDESGITSVLSFTTDGLFEKANLSGRAAFSLISGFGCTAAAILTTRGYSTESAQKRTIAVLPFIPCGAKMPVFLTFLSPLFKNPFPVITCFYFAGVAAAVIASLFLKGGGENMLSEVVRISMPRARTAAIKLCFYLKGFIIKVAGTVMAFCVISWVLSHYSITFEYVVVDESMLAAICRFLSPLFYPMGINDWRLCYAAVCGFAAKENVAASIAMLMPQGLNLGLAPTLAMCTFILLCPACISAFSASCKECGLRFTLKCVLVQLLTAFTGAYLVNLVFGL